MFREKTAEVPELAVTPRCDDGSQTLKMAVQRAAIREQLEWVLDSAAFRNSKRYSAFLRHIVEQTLEGQGESLKERTIGIQVFGREADYDTNQNHVVRSAASEIRKRLAQYYQDREHAAEIRIDVHPGSYVPQFQFPGEAPVEVAGLPEAPVQAPAAPRSPGRPWKRAHWAVLVCILAAGAVVALLATMAWSGRSHTALDRFWQPVVAPPTPLLLSVGVSYGLPAPAAQPSAGPATPQSYQVPSLGDLRAMTHQRLFAEDAVTLARLAGVVRNRGAQIRILTESATTLDDLRQGSAVLIGGGNNSWTRRLTSSLRFQMESPQGLPFPLVIRDKQHPAQTAWSPVLSNPFGHLSTDYVVAKDYAIVARVQSSETYQVTVVAAGITGYGTLAAGEFLTDPVYMSRLEAQAPTGWQRRNVEVVLSTDVINGIAGPPNIIAFYFW